MYFPNGLERASRRIRNGQIEWRIVAHQCLPHIEWWIRTSDREVGFVTCEQWFPHVGRRCHWWTELACTACQLAEISFAFKTEFNYNIHLNIIHSFHKNLLKYREENKAAVTKDSNCKIVRDLLDSKVKPTNIRNEKSSSRVDGSTDIDDVNHAHEHQIHQIYTRFTECHQPGSN